MARDNQLKFTFSTVSAGTNLIGVQTTLGGRSGAMKLIATASNWAIGYSDALNATRFRDQIADQSLLVSQTVTSAITGDNPVIGSTSDYNYYLRAAVGVAGMFGPAPCQIIVQGNDGVSGSAPTQTDLNWLPVSGIGTCASNCTATALTTSGTTGGFTVASGTTPIVGSIYIPSVIASSGLTAGTPYLVGPSSTLYTLAGAALSALTTANATSGVVGQFGTTGTISVSSFVAGTQVITGDVTPSVGDFITVVTAGTWTSGPSAAATYVVDSVTTTGGFTVKTFGSTAVTAFGAYTSGTVFVRWAFDRNPYITVSNTVTSNAFSVTAGAAGSNAAGHGLQVGSIVYLYSGSTSGVSLTTDQPYYVNSVPSNTTFTVATTINGATLAVTGATSAVFAVQRASKIVNVQIAKTSRAWMRAALLQTNSTTAQVGYASFLYADLSMGRDSAQVA